VNGVVRASLSGVRGGVGERLGICWSGEEIRLVEIESKSVETW